MSERLAARKGIPQPRGGRQSIWQTSFSVSKYTAGVTVVGGVNGPSYYWKYLEYGTKRIRERAFIRESAEARGDEAMEAVKREIEARLGIK